MLTCIGRGGFGKVWKVHSKYTKEIFALKVMLKLKVLNKNGHNSVMNERLILQEMKHPFIPKMHCAFQDFSHLYLCLDYIDGGDLRYHMCQNRKNFNEIQISKGE